MYLISDPSLTLDFSVSLFWGGVEGRKLKKHPKTNKNPSSNETGEWKDMKYSLLILCSTVDIYFLK